MRVSSVSRGLRIDWYKGDHKIADEGRFVHVDAIREDTFTLVIEESERADSGTYTCVASNDDKEEATCSAELTVNRAPAQDETALHVQQGEPVLFTIPAPDAPGT